MNKPYFCRNFFLTGWRHKRLKNKIDLLLFYREHFYGFSESAPVVVDGSNPHRRWPDDNSLGGLVTTNDRRFFSRAA